MNHTFQRVFLIVLDSLGIGAMPDAIAYGDAEADTFGHIWATQHGLTIPHLLRLGMGSLTNVDSETETTGYRLRLQEASNGKDTLTGHWEIAGLYTEEPFQTFTEHGFPADLIRELEQQFGREIIGNKAASGTAILDELAEEEIYRGKVIVYTSSDSVLQIPGNEETMGLETLYRYCEIARELTLQDKWKVGRVIARPYVGMKKGEFKRTANRKDYTLAPPKATMLDVLKEAKLDVIGVGKIHDIFSGEGLTDSMHSDSSVHGMQQTIKLLDRDFHGLCFTNLVDFDSQWGHRRDPEGYGKEIEAFDQSLGTFLSAMRPDDLLMITADHGNDPTYKGTDHTREEVPLLLYSPSFVSDGQLATRKTFGTIAATVLDNFGCTMPEHMIGESLRKELK